MTASQPNHNISDSGGPIVPNNQTTRVAQLLAEIRQTLEEFIALDNDSGTLSCPECDTIPINTGGDGAQKIAPSAPSPGFIPVIIDVRVTADVPPVSALGPAVVTHAPQSIQSDTPAISSPSLVPPAKHLPYQGVANKETETCWYVVTRGLKVGVFLGWGDVAPFVVGVPDARYQEASSLDIAYQQLKEAHERGDVQVLYQS